MVDCDKRGLKVLKNVVKPSGDIADIVTYREFMDQNYAPIS